MGTPHNVKVKPATALPWKAFYSLTLADIYSEDLKVARRIFRADAAYIAHAANAYPKLVEALRDLIGPAVGGYSDGYPDDGEVVTAEALLHDLGESN